MKGKEPPRLLDPRSEVPLGVREALEAGRDELPRDEQLQALAGKLDIPFWPGGPGDGGPDGGGIGGAAEGGAGAAASSILGGLKMAAVVVLAASVVGGSGLAIWHHRSSVPGPSPAPAPVSAPVPAPVSAPVPAPAPAPETETETETETEIGTVNGTGRERVREPDPELDVGLLRRAQDALSSSPRRSLELLRQHATLFPRSALVQEREVIAIEALTRIGRREDARSRADRFRSRWPSSSHRGRIDRLIGDAPHRSDGAIER